MKRRYYWLDVIRAVAMLAVVSGHYRNVLFPMWNNIADKSDLCTLLVYGLTQWGHFAVVAFFVLSGFLVGGRSFESFLNGKFCLVDFIKRRCVRILPSLGLSCVLCCSVFLCLGISVPWGRVLCNFLSLQGVCCKSLLAPWWALSVEVWFYIFCGSLLGFLTSHGLVRGLCGLISLMIGVFMFSCHRGYFLCFILGGLVYFLQPRCTSIIRSLVSIVLFVLSICFVKMVHLPSEVNDVVFALGLSLLIRELVVCEPKSRVARGVNVVGTWLSTPSYSIYLSHMLVMILLTHLVFTPAASATVDREYMIGKGVLEAFSKVGLLEMSMMLCSLVIACVVGGGLHYMVEILWRKRCVG